MVYQAAKFDGFWVDPDEFSSQRTDGRLVVMSSASRPLEWEDLENKPASSVSEIAEDSLYLIRCTVIQSGILTSLVVEKYRSWGTWEFVDPNALRKMEKGVEVLEGGSG